MTQENILLGLTTSEVEESRRQHGINILTPPKKASLWEQFMEKFEDPIIRILLCAWILAMIISAYHCWGPENAGWEAFIEPIGIFFAIASLTVRPPGFVIIMSDASIITSTLFT